MLTRRDAERLSCLPIARTLIAGKIQNCRTLLRRNVPEAARDGLQPTLRALKLRAADAEAATSEAQLLGIEGDAARQYFGAFAELIRPRSGARAEFDFNSRNRRPPRDPVNALPSFAYALLVKDLRIALLGVGFDLMVGVFHLPRAGRRTPRARARSDGGVPPAHRGLGGSVGD